MHVEAGLVHSFEGGKCWAIGPTYQKLIVIENLQISTEIKGTLTNF